MFSLKNSFADCSSCPLLKAPSCILETNCKDDLSKVDIIFISENPGKDEVKKEIPLIGRAGKTFRKPFDKYIKKNCNWLLTNCVLCLTLDEQGNTGNPTDDVIEKCKVNCFEIVKQCSPSLVVLMGTSPMKAFGIAKSGITNLRGQMFKWEGFDILVTIHPSFVNRNKSYSKDFEEDIKMAAVYIGESFEREDTKSMKTKEIVKGIHRYEIPEKFYTDEYRLIDIQFLSKTSQILYIFRDKDNKKVYHKENDDYYCYVCPSGADAKKIVPYNDLIQMKVPYKQKTKLDPNITYEGDLKLTAKHAMDYYHFNKGEAPKICMNIMFCDIEVDTGLNNREFPQPKEAKYPINMISCIFQEQKKKITYILDNKTEPITEKEGVELKIFDTEKKMLLAFIKDWKEYDSDFVTGWNCIYQNEIIFLNDRLICLKDLENKSKTYKYGDVKNISSINEKKCIELELMTGHRITASKEHKFPVYIKKNDNTYYTPELLLNTESELTIQQIINHKDEIFFKVEKCINNNTDYTFGDLIKENIEVLLEYNLVDIKIISKKLRQKVIQTGDHKKIFKRCDYWCGSRCYLHYLWSYKNLKQYISINDIKNQLNEFDYQVFKIGKVSNLTINMNKIIDKDILKLLGFLYTDGFWSRTEGGFCFDNKDENIVKYYNSIMNQYRKNAIGYEHKWNKRDNLWTFGFGFVNEFILLMPLVYFNKRNKRLNVTSLSRLSQEQWGAFFSGLIDGDGSASKSSISISNFEDDGKDCKRLHNLSTWNGAFSYLRKNCIRIPRIISNSNFFDLLDCQHTYKKEWTNSKNLREPKNSCSNIIDKFIFKDFMLVKLKSFKETDLLKTLDLETQKHYFICNGIKTHNCISFDFEYIYNRLPKLKIQHSVMSKFGEFYVNSRWFACKVAGCVILDQDHLYKSFTFTKKENYKLGFIAQEELKITKIVLPLHINEMYWKMLNKTIEYNIRDTELLEKLEDKLGHVNLLNELRVICNSSFDSAGSGFGQIDCTIVSYLREHGLASKNSDPHITKDEYPGAYVQPPIPGIYDHITDFDFTSLYPSIIMTYNIGVNNYVMKTKDSTVGYNLTYHPEKLEAEIDVIIDPMFKAKKGKIKKEDLLNKIKENNLIHTINGCFFKTHKDEMSVYSLVLENLLSARRAYKKKMLDAKESGDKATSDFYDTKQMVYKILANTLYGVVANQAFRFFNTDCAAAVTLSGQEALKASIIESDTFVEHLYSRNKIERPPELTKREMYSDKMPNRQPRFIIAGDTDSVFVCFQEFPGKKTDEEIKVWCDQIQNYLNNDIIKPIVKRHNVSLEFNKLDLKNELIISRGLFLAKKRYVIHVVNNEGRKVDEMKYMGLEIKRRDFPSHSKKFLKELIERIIKTKTVSISSLLKFVESQEKEFIKLIKKGSKTIARPVSYGKSIDKYKVVPQAVRAMEAFNQISYRAHTVGSMGYLFHVNGIDTDKAPNDIIKNYDKFLREGKKLTVVGIPDEELFLPSYYIPNVKAQLKFTFIDRYELLLAPITEVNKSEGILSI